MGTFYLPLRRGAELGDLGRGPLLLAEPADDHLARPEEAGGDGRLADTERTSRLAVGEAEQVDRDQGEAVALGQLGDRVVELPDFERPHRRLRGVPVEHLRVL